MKAIERDFEIRFKEIRDSDQQPRTSCLAIYPRNSDMVYKIYSTGECTVERLYGRKD